MLLARRDVAFGTAIYLSHEIMSESAKHSIKGRSVEQCFTQELTMESVTTDKPDASCASDDVGEHLGSSSTANGYRVIHCQLP